VGTSGPVHWCSRLAITLLGHGWSARRHDFDAEKLFRQRGTRLEQLLTRDHRQTATPRGDHSMALGRSPTAVVDFGAVKIQVDGRKLVIGIGSFGEEISSIGIGSFTTGVVDSRVKIREK
jgi:hypothetical protein